VRFRAPLWLLNLNFNTTDCSNRQEDNIAYAMDAEQLGTLRFKHVEDDVIL
jgi:hypothetical protein